MTNNDSRAGGEGEDLGVLLDQAYKALMHDRLDEAHRLFMEILRRSDCVPHAWQGVAILEHRRGNYTAAVNAINNAVALKPDESGFWSNRGAMLKALGPQTGAERILSYRRAVALNPQFKDAYINLSSALTESQRYDEAQTALRMALRIDPSDVDAQLNAAKLTRAQGDARGALAAVDTVLRWHTGPEALNLKGAMLTEMGDHHAAIIVLEQARQQAPANPFILNNLGTAYLATGHADRAVDIYGQALALAPMLPETLVNMVLGLLAQIKVGRPRAECLMQAQAHLATAQSVAAGVYEVYIAEGELKVQQLGDYQGAETAFEQALALRRDSVQALKGLAVIASETGARARAQEFFRRAVALAPANTGLMTSYISALNYNPDSNPQEAFDAACQFGRHIQARFGRPYGHWANDRDGGRRLRLGFVSGDFKTHPVGFFIASLFENLPRDQVETFAYHNTIIADGLTQRCREAVDHWRPIVEMGTAAVCERVRDDGIDILVDLSGHTVGNRLDVFAAKPAPVSASWLGFVTSTGLDTVDCLLADPVVAPHEHQRFFKERLVHLPVLASLDLRPDIAAVVAAPPCLERGYVTFGSFNNPIKINERVIHYWARILRAVPCSRLLLKYRGFDDPAVQSRFRDAFAREAIRTDRLIFSGWSPNRRASLEFWREADIALDTFPYSGATTTLETLFMGVPVVTLLGDRFAGRMAAGYLHHLGLGEWVARDLDHYCRIAAALANSPERLALWRADLRTRLLSSSAGDPRLFAGQWLSVLRDQWLIYCREG